MLFLRVPVISCTNKLPSLGIEFIVLSVLICCRHMHIPHLNIYAAESLTSFVIFISHLTVEYIIADSKIPILC